MVHGFIKIHKAALLNFTTMIKELDITIDSAELNCSVNFEYFKDSDEVDIRIYDIKHGSIEVSELLSAEQIEDIKWKCQVHYEQHSFDFWEQRYEERNSGLARD
jgi:hypothetical protein